MNNRLFLFNNVHENASPIVDIYKTHLNCIYHAGGIKQVILTISKLNKNIFLSKYQKKEIKTFVARGLRLKLIIQKFINKLMYTIRNKKNSINEYTLDLQTKIDDLPASDTISIYSGLSKWSFTCHELNRLFLVGIHQFEMTES